MIDILKNTKILTSSPKTQKSEKYGFHTGVAYLAPADFAQRYAHHAFEDQAESLAIKQLLIDQKINLCPNASKACKAACLGFYSGHAAIIKKGEKTNPMRNARIRRALCYSLDYERFKAALIADIYRIIGESIRYGLKPAIRVNGSSDIDILRLKVVDMFPNVMFYDYTKNLEYAKKVKKLRLDNYRVVFSANNNNHSQVLEALRLGINVAIVMDKLHDKVTINNEVYRVVDGDSHDLRFLETTPYQRKGKVVRLSPKGLTKKKKESLFKSGFAWKGDAFLISESNPRKKGVA